MYLSKSEFKTIEKVLMMLPSGESVTIDGKPDESVRKLLKSYSFKWAPSQKAWQRTLTRDAKWAAERIMAELDERSKESA